MTSTAEEKAFLRVAVAAIPRVTEIIQGFPPDDRAGALETAERRFLVAAFDYGCTEVAARSRVSAVMRRLRGRLERQRASEKKLQALLHRTRRTGLIPVRGRSPLDAALCGQLAERRLRSRSCTSFVLVCLVLYRDDCVGDCVLLQLFL